MTSVVDLCVYGSDQVLRLLLFLISSRDFVRCRANNGVVH